MIHEKHILFVFRSLGTGGSQKVQAFVANACVKNGYKVSIINMSNELCSLDLNENIVIYNLDYDRISNENNFLMKNISKMNYVYQFRKKCIELNPDLIIAFLIDIVRLTIIALKGTKYLIIGSERADPSQFGDKKRKKYNKSLNKCNGVVFQLNEAASYYSLDSKILSEVIPNPSIYRNRPENKSNKIREKFIFGAGRLTKQKRFDLLIDAYNIIHMKYPEYRLKIYGDGIELDNLLNKVKMLNLQDYVDFEGNVKNVFANIPDKSIFVLSSDYEGIPNIITEALLHGIPCVSTDCSPGGARLLLNNGDCGELVNKGDYKQIANSVIKLIENPSMAETKANNGKKYIRMFDPHLIEEKWITFIEKVIEI